MFAVCVNATYNRKTIGLDLSIGIDGHYYTQEISGKEKLPCYDLLLMEFD